MLRVEKVDMGKIGNGVVGVRSSNLPAQINIDIGLGGKPKLFSAMRFFGGRSYQGPVVLFLARAEKPFFPSKKSYAGERDHRAEKFARQLDPWICSRHAALGHREAMFSGKVFPESRCGARELDKAACGGGD